MNTETLSAALQPYAAKVTTAAVAVAQIKPGTVLYEMEGVPEDQAREAMRLAAAKLPIKTRFIERIAE